MAKVAVIVPAAGASSRFGGKEKKPFAKIGERAVFLRTLELFINRNDVCQTILAVSPDDYEMVKTRYGANLGFMSVKVVKGGAERYQTVQAALEVVDAEAELVAIHDAVRPCVTADKITEVFQAAEKHGAAILASPVTATLKKAEADGSVAQTVDRSGLHMAQTPQVFKATLIKEAYQKLSAAKETQNITDDAQVVEMAGGKVFLVPNDQTNIKITVQSDLKLAEAILAILPKPKAKGPTNPFEEAQW
jgi:2-C-methyl-D-erythritol 4-phosphate cytidylyltransferase